MPVRTEFFYTGATNSFQAGSAATGSSAAVSAQTRFVQIFHGTNSVSPIWASSENTAVTSVDGMPIPFNWPLVVKVTPGQRVYARSNVIAASCIVYVTELND